MGRRAAKPAPSSSRFYFHFNPQLAIPLPLQLISHSRVSSSGCSSNPSESSTRSVIPSPEARRSLMKLTQRMIRTFCFNISTSGGDRRHKRGPCVGSKEFRAPNVKVLSKGKEVMLPRNGTKGFVFPAQTTNVCELLAMVKNTGKPPFQRKPQVDLKSRLGKTQVPVTCHVSAIIKRRKMQGKECFEVEWREFVGIKISIVPADLIECACPEMLVEFKERMQGKKNKRKPRTKKTEKTAAVEELDLKLQSLMFDI